MTAPFPEHASGFIKTYRTLIWTTNLLTVAHLIELKDVTE